MTDSMQQIPLATLDAVRKPIAEANGMPNAVYDDPAMFEYERDNVLGKTWAGLAFGSELPKKALRNQLISWACRWRSCATAMAKSMCSITSAATGV
ncbi:hypothetical protein [Aliamphritea spongicola]|nr:hypothetical protein [Aliamphritea spongicola]